MICLFFTTDKMGPKSLPNLTPSLKGRRSLSTTISTPPVREGAFSYIHIQTTDFILFFIFNYFITALYPHLARPVFALCLVHGLCINGNNHIRPVKQQKQKDSN